MSSRSTERGAVSVAEVDIDGRYVRLKNNSETVRLSLLVFFYFVYLNQYQLFTYDVSYPNFIRVLEALVALQHVKPVC